MSERETSKPDLEASLRAGGLRPTAQRYSVLKYLTRRPVHATAEEIFSALNRQFPLASRATVYNALRDLTRAGLIRELASEGKAALFDANLHPHHHFVCDECGALEDIEWFDIPDQSRQAAADGRAVRSYEITFHGICGRCSTGPQKTQASPDSFQNGEKHG